MAELGALPCSGSLGLGHCILHGNQTAWVTFGDRILTIEGHARNEPRGLCLCLCTHTHCKPLQNTQHHRLLAVQSSLTGLEPQSYTEWLFLHLSLSLSTLTPALLLLARQDRFPSKTAGQGAWETSGQPTPAPEVGG